jgi:membrane associated rhomboid family serine protease/tetratricopeptide (TPR) repeat protein
MANRKGRAMVMALWDHGPSKWPTLPYVTWLLVVINFIVLVVQVAGGPQQMYQAHRIAGVTPAAFTGHSVGGLWPPLTLLTYQFLHSNFLHVFLNMIFLFAFGGDIEKVLGHWRFLAFYLLCGIGAALVFVMSSPSSTTNLIGASGAVAGVLSACLLFRPVSRVGPSFLRFRAYGVIGFWAISQVLQAVNRVEDGTAYWGHVGGLITGAVLFIVMRPAGVKLFDWVHSGPVSAAGKSEPLGVTRFIMHIAAVITTIVAITTLASLTMPAAQWRTCVGYPGVDQDTKIGSCTALIQSDPERARDRAFAFNNRGVAWLAKGDNDRAIADFTEAIRFDPKNSWTFNNRGWAFNKKSDYDRALADLDEAIRLDPKSDVAYFNRSVSYNGKRDYDRAISDLDVSIRLMPTVANAWVERGQNYNSKGDYDRAIADFSEAIRLDPKNAEYLNALCWARAIAGRELPLAVTDCTEALRIAPNDANIMDSRGFVYLRLSRLDDAVADYDEALRRNPKQAGSLYGRGLAKLRKGDVAGSEADIAAAKAIQANIAEEFARYGVTPSDDWLPIQSVPPFPSNIR